jgi:hypothetical protein
MFNVPVQQAVTCALCDRQRCWNEEKNDTNKQSTAARKSQIRKFADFNNVTFAEMWHFAETQQQYVTVTYWKLLHLCNTSSYHIVCLFCISTTLYRVLYKVYILYLHGTERQETSIAIFVAKCLQCASR